MKVGSALYRLIDILHSDDSMSDLYLMPDYEHKSRFKNHKLLAYITCNDCFYWGSADMEEIGESDLDELDQAIKDTNAVQDEKGYACDGWAGTLLWVARKRKLRPQGALYKSFKTEEVRELFNQAGPDRGIDILNPYTRDNEYQYKPLAKEIEDDIPA